MYYAKSTNGFYSRDIHGDNIPADAVEITQERHSELMAAQGEGLQIIGDKDGYPIAVDPDSLLTLEELAERKKAQYKARAESLLQASDWVEVPSVSDPESDPYLTNKADFVVYRNALRKIAVTPTPESVFPDKPEEVWS